MLFKSYSILLPTTLSLLLVASANATTRRVPSEYPTIQAGILAAALDDTVLVAPGTYTGPGNYRINFDGKDLVLLSETGPSGTIIDAQGSFSAPRSVFKIEEPITNAARIEGFTIRGGYSFRTLFPRGGGGIWCMFGSPTVSNCIITDNNGDGGGTAVGGGVLFVESQGRIIDCVIANNDLDPGAGGGLGIVNSPGVTVTRCSIVNNDFGGVYLANSNVTFENCTIAGNSEIGAISFASGASATLDRCIVWGNCPELYVFHPTSSVTLTCCVVDSSTNSGGGTIVYGQGNVFSDPLFCDAAPCAGRAGGVMDYRLSSSSPALPEHNPCGMLIGALGSCEAETDVPPSAYRPEAALWVSPNPFTTNATLSFSAVSPNATLTIFDIAGRRVREFRLANGDRSVIWDGNDERGIRLSAGMYFVRSQFGTRRETIRVTLVR